MMTTHRPGALQIHRPGHADTGAGPKCARPRLRTWGGRSQSLARPDPAFRCEPHVEKIPRLKNNQTIKGARPDGVCAVRSSQRFARVRGSQFASGAAQ
jgi:hypothetical protein